jgi:hypothetical protein
MVAMKPFDPPEHGNIPTPPRGADRAGAVVLALLAAAAFCGWYLTVVDSQSETDPLPVVQKPIMPPTTTDVSADLPGQTHYTVLSPVTQQAHDAKTP